MLSVGETYMKPTTMLYRNLLAMETEEIIRANPVDGVVLLGGCDKTVPGLIMGATSANLPAIFVSAGPMLRGNWRGQVLGSGSDVWKYWAEKRAGNLDDCAWNEMEDGIARSFGTCMTMGTASTMAAAAEALGLMLPGGSSIPAADANHPRLASDSGRRIVEMVWEDLKPRDVMTTEAFENAVTVTMSLGGSTNAIIHLIAMAGRAGVPLDLDRFDALSRRTPVVGNIRPSGKYLMEDFFYAGGLRASMSRISDLLHTDAITVNGRTPGREHRRRPGLRRGRDPSPRPPHEPGRRGRRAARQPRSAGRGHQAHRQRAAAAPAHRAGGGLQGLQRPRRAASTTPPCP